MGDQPVKGPTVVCSGFIERGGKFLLIFCPVFKVWRVPGGRAEWNEKSLVETFIREMKEEIGLGIKDPKFLGYGQDHQFNVRDGRETSRLLMFFHARITEEPKIDPDEAEEFKWVTFQELKVHENVEGALKDFFRMNPELKL